MMSYTTTTTDRPLKRRRRERQRYAHEARAFCQMLVDAGLAHLVYELNEGPPIARAQATQYANQELCCADCLAGDFCSQHNISD